MLSKVPSRLKSMIIAIPQQRLELIKDTGSLIWNLSGHIPGIRSSVTEHR